jgi:hypothetical protein
MVLMPCKFSYIYPAGLCIVSKLVSHILEQERPKENESDRRINEYIDVW